MKEKLGDKARLEHILSSIGHIRKFTEGKSLDSFFGDELVFSATIRHLSIIGEAATNLTSQLREKHPEILWSKLIGMRNVLVHKYFGIDEIVLFKTVVEDLPILETQIETILKELE